MQSAKHLYNATVNKPKKQTDAKPLLFIDVDIGDSEDRITIYPKDDPKVLARLFCKKHGIEDEETEGLLLQQLLDKIKRVRDFTPLPEEPPQILKENQVIVEDLDQHVQVSVPAFSTRKLSSHRSKYQEFTEDEGETPTRMAKSINSNKSRRSRYSRQPKEVSINLSITQGQSPPDNRDEEH